jgi:hypothetical protein
MTTTKRLIPSSTAPAAVPNDKYTPEAYAAEIRRRAPRALKDHLSGISATRTPVLEALILCGHLRPGQIETAIWCHRVLVRKIKRDLDRMGFPGDGNDLIMPLFNFLDGSDRWYERGNWITREEHFASLKATA